MENRTEYSNHIIKSHVVGFQTQINKSKNEYKVVFSMSNGESHSKSFHTIYDLTDFIKVFDSMFLTKW